MRRSAVMGCGGHPFGRDPTSDPRPVARLPDRIARGRWGRLRQSAHAVASIVAVCYRPRHDHRRPADRGRDPHRLPEAPRRPDAPPGRDVRHPDVARSRGSRVQGHRALRFREERTADVSNYDELKAQIEKGFARAYWAGTTEDEQRIQDEIRATIRCIPLDQPGSGGTCVYTGKPATQQVLFARAY